MHSRRQLYGLPVRLLPVDKEMEMHHPLGHDFHLLILRVRESECDEMDLQFGRLLRQRLRLDVTSLPHLIGVEIEIEHRGVGERLSVDIERVHKDRPPHAERSGILEIIDFDCGGIPRESRKHENERRKET